MRGLANGAATTDRSFGFRAHAARVALGIVLAAAPAAAHTLDTGTARVSLRDAHLEVHAEWDVFAAADTTPTALAIATPEEAVEAHARLRRTLEEGSWLEVDGRARRLAITAFPSVDELRALAATLSAQGLEHGALVRVRLEAAEALLDAERVHVRFPTAVGPVLTTFVQPSAVFAPPGAVARFGVLVPRARGAVPAEPSIAWAFGALASLAAVALARVLQQRKPS
jgi:hypothetical protein